MRPKCCRLIAGRPSARARRCASRTTWIGFTPNARSACCSRVVPVVRFATVRALQPFSWRGVSGRGHPYLRLKSDADEGLGWGESLMRLFGRSLIRDWVRDESCFLAFLREHAFRVTGKPKAAYPASNPPMRRTRHLELARQQPPVCQRSQPAARAVSCPQAARRHVAFARYGPPRNPSCTTEASPCYAPRRPDATSRAMRLFREHH